MVKKVALTKWFLFCEDAHSNEVVALAIDGLHGASTDFKLMMCADGVERCLYKVPDYQFGNQFLRSQYQLKAKFQLFTSQNDGKPKAWKSIVRQSKPKISEIRRKSEAIKKSALMPR
jgi:hypothetical protein